MTGTELNEVNFIEMTKIIAFADSINYVRQSNGGERVTKVSGMGDI